MGGIEAMLKVMNAHINIYILCKYVCVTLLFMMNADSCNSKIIIYMINTEKYKIGDKTLIREAGGIETMTKAMNIHINNLEMCLYCCNVIKNMVQGDCIQHILK